MSACLESLLDRERRAACTANDAAIAMATRTVTRASRMVTTSSGITIGIAHQPKPQEMGSHAEKIQSALLKPGTAQRLSPVQRLIDALWRFA